jgi:polyisoprenoid-binding protein YceI
MRIGAAVFVLAMLLAEAVPSAPVSYGLDPARSEVGFTYRLLGAATRGRMPVAQAEIRIDFADLSATFADVTLNVRDARAGLIFATEAMLGPTVLDATRHPTIRFRSRRTYAAEGGAVMEGDLTIRGITRPVALRARFLRPPGSDPAARDRLSIELTGAVSRSSFGAAGYPDIVDDRIDLRIRAGLDRAD